MTLFDVYEGDKLHLPERSRHKARLCFAGQGRTLTDQIIDRVMNNLLVQFEKQAGAVVRYSRRMPRLL